MTKTHASSLLSHLENAVATHLITHFRQNAKNQIRKMLTIDPQTMETTRKAKILQSFANKKIAAILRADLAKTYGMAIASSVLNDEQYQAILSDGLTVLHAREIYAAAG
jgi:prephenate dehydratase